MRPYFDRFPGEEKRAIDLYEQNIRLAESLVPSLSVFEVTLRNAVIRELERMTGSKEWYSFFQTHPVLRSLWGYITTASKHIANRGEVVTPDKINGELTMGFWVSLFNAEYEMYLWKDLRRAFPNLPKHRRQRKTVSTPLNIIHSLRNRTFHHETICWNLTKLSSLHDLIIEVICWMNPDLQKWLSRVDRYEQVVLSVRKKWHGWWKYILFRFSL